MLTLRADENRYLVYGSSEDQRELRRFPGGRFNQQQRCWIFPRQQGVLVALDAAFGRDAWQPDGDVAIDVAESRSRVFEPARFDAHVSLDGSQLAVECAVADKEIVKLIPGYRWSPANRRWFVAARPMALDILQERFGPRLIVDDDARVYIELRRQDDEARPLELEPVTAPAAAPAEPTIHPAPPAPVAIEPAAILPLDGDVLAAAIDALAAAVARLESKLDQILGAGGSAPIVPIAQPAAPAAASEAPRQAAEAWRTILALADQDPDAALDQANRALQTAEDDDPALRAAAGVAAERCGAHEQAYRHLSRALESAESLPQALQPLAVTAFRTTALALVNDELQPRVPVDSTEAFRRAVRQELYEGGVFAGGHGAGTTLDVLVNDRALRRADPELSDTARVAQLLRTARGGARLGAERVASVLREGSLQPEAAALGMILYANACMGEEFVSEWVEGWPASEEEAPVKDGGWLVGLALDVLPRVEPELAAIGALAVLGCIAPGPAGQASLVQRRQLVNLIGQSWPYRRTAEFLAAFRLAAAGERIQVTTQFPGYLQRIGESNLVNSSPHLAEVFLAGSSVTGSAVKPIAEGPYLKAMTRWGITDPGAQVLDLLDLVAEGSRADNAINAIGRMIEERAFPGADRFDRQQRKAVYERALHESNRTGHDEDAREAFDRLVRELRDEGAVSELEVLSRGQSLGMRALRIPSLVVLLECELENRIEFEATLEALVNAANFKGKDDENPVSELQGLIEVFPEIDPPLRRMLEHRGLPPTAEVTHPDLSGRRVLLVGGHRWLQKYAGPVLTDRWNLEITWLDPDEAKRGHQPLHLAAGSADVVVINTRCIGHAASGRVAEEAKRSGKPVAYQGSHGVGAMLQFVRSQLEAIAQAPPEKKQQRKATDRKKLIR